MAELQGYRWSQTEVMVSSQAWAQVSKEGQLQALDASVFRREVARYLAGDRDDSACGAAIVAAFLQAGITWERLQDDQYKGFTTLTSEGNGT